MVVGFALAYPPTPPSQPSPTTQKEDIYYSKEVYLVKKLTRVGFEPTHISVVEI
jgi:hypothetical protein